MPVKLVLAAVVVVASSCVPCAPVDRSRPQDVCHPADAGAIAAGSPFPLMASTTVVGATCAVTVDGGQVDLFISGSQYCGAGNKPVVFTQLVRCEVPALPDGSYALNTLTPQSFSLPDAGFPPCP